MSSQLSGLTVRFVSDESCRLNASFILAYALSTARDIPRGASNVWRL